MIPKTCSERPVLNLVEVSRTILIVLSLITLILYFTTLNCFAQSAHWINNNVKIQIKSGTWIVVPSDIVNQNNGTFDNSGDINLYGNWTNNAGNAAFINSSPGTVSLKGDMQTIGGSDPTLFYNLNLQGTGVKNLNINSMAEGVLSLNDRELNTSNYSMSVLSADTSSITRTTGYVSSTGTGYLTRVTNTPLPYFFPVGSNIGIFRYRPVAITPTTASSNSFSVRMANADATTEGFDRSITDGIAGNINDLFYHKINHIAGSDAASISIYFDDVDDGAFFGIAHWDDTPSDQWENTGTVTSVNNASPALSSLTIANWDDFTGTPLALFSCVPSVAADSVTFNPDPVCEEQPLTLTVHGGSLGTGASWEWYTGGCGSTYVGTGNTLIQSVSVTTTYYVRAEGTCGITECKSVIVKPAALNPVSLTIAPDNNPVCDGTNVTFTATPINEGANPQYQWYLNGTTVGTSSSTYSNNLLSNTDEIYCVLTSDANCATGNPATSNTVTITVNPNLPVSVTIAADATTICDGTNVTFTATPTNEGANPQYQWYLNGSVDGTNSNTYSNNLLSNTDEIYCVLTSDATCTTGSPATSNTVAMTVNSNLPVSVTIAADATTICDGTNVTFTATPTNGGANPQYQWYLNGSVDGTNSNTYSNNLLSNADEIYCILTSDATCATGSPATSNTVTMTVSSDLPVSVTIAADATTICDGTNVTLTATPTNGGSNPQYQWYLNGATVGTSSSTYTNATLSDADGIYCVLTSDETCATGSPATSNTLTMTVNSNLPVSVTIAADATTICDGTNVTFTATPVNGGSNPQYQWYLNGATVGTSSSTYTNATLSDADGIYCVLTSDETCATGSPATSNTVAMTVNSNLPVSVTIAADATTICDGTNVTFTATPTNGGSNPQYQWYLNGATVGTSISTYTNNLLSNTDEIYCVLTSDETCATGSPATSNTLAMTVNSNLPVSVTIAADATTICDGTNVTFTVTPTNGGSNPQYQWYLNGATVGTSISTYTNNLLSNTDEIYCVLTSDETCATGSPATSNTVAMTVNSNLPVSVTIVADATTICDGTNVTFTATPTNGGSNPQYQWYLNGATVGTSISTYTNNLLSNADEIYCVLTSDETCATGSPATSNTLAMTVSPDVPVLLVTDPVPSCSIAIDITDAAITSGSSYILTLSYWNDAGATIPVSNPNAITISGTYYIVAENGCGSDTADVNVYFNTSAPSLVINNPDPVCNALVDITVAAVTAGSSGIVSISYWTDAGALNSLAKPDSISLSGTYYIQAINACGTDIEAVNVTITTGLPLLIINNPTPVCTPLFVDLTDPAVTSGSTQIVTISYWANSALNIPLNHPDSVTISGIYYILAGNTCGTDTMPVAVYVFPSAPELVINSPATACSPAQVDLTVDTITSGSTGIYALSYWMDAGATVPLANPQAVTQSGLYFIQAINTCGTDIEPVTVNISIGSPVLTIHNPDVLCSGGSVDLTSTAITSGSLQVLELSYWMDNSAIVPLANPTNVTTAGTYYIMAWNGCGSDIEPVQVMVSTVLQVASTISHESCESGSDGRLVLVVTGGTAPYLYAWSNGETTATISSLAPGLYTVTVTDASNCFETETFTIDASTVPCNELFIPTIFTPDGNGENDILYARGKRILELDMMIFDRIGNKVFETKDKNIGWDGNYKEKPLNSAVFVYYVKAKFEDGEVIEKKGDITLIR